MLLNGRVLTPEAGLVRKPGEPGIFASGNLLPESKITIPPGGRDLELHYTGISFGSPEKLRFRYNMQGLNRDWVEAGERRAAYYHHLAPGRYLFSVLACNADGVWSEEASSLDIGWMKLSGPLIPRTTTSPASPSTSAASRTSSSRTAPCAAGRCLPDNNAWSRSN